MKRIGEFVLEDPDRGCDRLRIVNVDLDEIRYVLDITIGRGNSNDDLKLTRDTRIVFRDGTSIDVMEPRQNVLRIWAGLDLLPEEFAPGGILSPGGRHGTERYAPTLRVPDGSKVDADANDVQTEGDRIQQSQLFKELVHPLIPSGGVSTLELRQHLREQLTEERVEKLQPLAGYMASLGSPVPLPWGVVSIVDDNEPTEPRDAAVLQKAWIDALVRFYRPAPFDVEETDPESCPDVREAWVAINTVKRQQSPNDETIGWAIGKTRRAIAFIDRYYGRGNYPRYDELVGFLNEHRGF